MHLVQFIMSHFLRLYLILLSLNRRRKNVLRNVDEMILKKKTHGAHYAFTPITSTSQSVRNSVMIEISTYRPSVYGGHCRTTSCDRVPGPAKKAQNVLMEEEVTPTATVTSRRRAD